MSGPESRKLLSVQPDASSKRQVVDAVYTDGVLRPATPLGIPDGAPVHVTIKSKTKTEAEVEDNAVEPAQVAAPVRSTSPLRLEALLFGLGLLVYLFTRLYAIDRFPIFFFADEATQVVYAQDLLDRGLKDAQGYFMPIYFKAASNRWTPLLSVYVHTISVALFGKSVFVTRATSALVSLLAAVAVALILRLGFKSRTWWVGVLLLAVAPAWFLHSRTGFETVMMSSFFACFLGCYLLYRTRSPRYLFVALICGALTFYTYSSGQMIMASVGAALGISDIRYHLKQWRTTGLGLILLALLALPVLRFRALNPQFMTITLRTMDSYWFHDLTLAQKVEEFIRTWAHGLSPAFWFIPSQTLLVRHRMEGYGNLSVWLLPFFLIGVVWCLWKIKSPAPRAVVLTALVTPMGAALVKDVGITRVLAFTIPASLLIAIGIGALLDFLDRRLHMRPAIVAIALFAGLSVASLGMLRDAVVHGPLWFRDYGLYGMQYGATQLFGDAIPGYLREYPGSQVMVSPTWANGAENFVRFFLSQEQQARVQMLNVDYFMETRRELTPNMVLVMTPDEYQRAQTSGKFKAIDVLRIVPYPDGSPGFYFARLAYVDNLEAIIQQERAARSQPVTESVVIDGQTVRITHSQFDMGQPLNLFDGDTFTLARGLEANPLILELTFPEPRAITGLAVDFASMDFTLTAKLYPAEGAEPKVYSQTFQKLPPDPHVEMAFAGAPEGVKKLRLEVLQLNAPLDPHIHVRELKFIQ